MNKVVLLAPTPPPAGGIAGWTIRMMNANLKNEWGVEVVDEKLLGNTETFGEGSKRHIRDEIVRTIRIWRNLKSKLNDNNVKIVHSCIPSTTLAMIREYVCALITHKRRKKFIIHFRCTTGNTTKGKIGRFVLKRLCRVADHVIVLNTPSYEHIRNICNTSVEIIPNFVEENEIIGHRIINKEVKTALYVGGVIPEKGCEIICQVAREFPGIKFRMVGRADQSIIDISKEIKNVVLTGPKGKDQVREELENADLFLFLSCFRGEGFSNALVEAMAYGLPCVVSDWAANADMIGGAGGVVVPIDNITETIEAINNELDYQIRQVQSTANIAKVKRCYSSNVVLDKYVDCYERICSK